MIPGSENLLGLLHSMQTEYVELHLFLFFFIFTSHPRAMRFMTCVTVEDGGNQSGGLNSRLNPVQACVGYSGLLAILGHQTSYN